MNAQLLKQLEEVNDLYQQYLKQSHLLTDEQFNYKPNANSWSIAQVLHHIWFALDSTYLYIDKLMKNRSEFQSAGIVHKIRSIGLNLVLHSKLKLKAPKYILNNIPNHITHAEMNHLFNASIEKFRQLLVSFPEELEHKEIFKHPIVGWVNISQTLGFLKGHTIHHKMQIEELLATLTKK